MQAKMAERGRVTIPKALRERLIIVPGTVLDFIEEQGRLLARKTEAVDAVDLVFGRLGRGRNTDDIIGSLEKVPAGRSDGCLRHGLGGGGYCLRGQPEGSGRSPSGHADRIFGTEHGVSLGGGSILACLPTARRGPESNRCRFSDRRTCSGAGATAVDARPWFL
jgi:AbrB family looped-hinge helix DNA binding protein